MSEILNYTIEFTSDAEIGAGFGSESVGSWVPRNRDGVPYVPATQIKGLMKYSVEHLLKKCCLHDLKEAFEKAAVKLLGKAGADVENQSAFQIQDAVSEKPVRTLMVTRTALNEKGVAKDGALRTVEVIAAGSVFHGTLLIDKGLGDGYKDLLKFALLSVLSVGGSKSRGAGACIISIENESRTPGKILAGLSDVKTFSLPEPKHTEIKQQGSHDKLVWCDLRLEALAPLCLPENPVIGRNQISSGFEIPASAVQGIILNKIGEVSSDLADQCFDSSNFRCWPMLPALRVPTTPEGGQGFPVRVSTTHKISKLPLPENPEKFEFFDETIEAIDWTKRDSRSPLKSADGVLLNMQNQGITLWKSADMPRVLTNHGVHRDSEGNRNLFSVESIAVSNYRGLLALPEDCAYALSTALEKSDSVLVGKSRSVRGSGRLSLKILDAAPSSLKNHHKTFVLQSPVLIDFDAKGKSIQQIIANAVKKTDWGEVDECAGQVKVLFGWNRHRKGLQSAKLVLVPGTIFRLKEPLKDISSKLAAGLGQGREQGLGAVLPHPGIAETLYREKPEKKSISGQKRDESTAGWAVKLYKENKNPKLSASQVASLRMHCGADKGLSAYLNKVKAEKHDLSWSRYESVEKTLQDLDKFEKNFQMGVLKLWQDLIVAEKGKEVN